MISTLLNALRLLALDEELQQGCINQICEIILISKKIQNYSLFPHTERGVEMSFVLAQTLHLYPEIWIVFSYLKHGNLC